MTRARDQGADDYRERMLHRFGAPPSSRSRGDGASSLMATDDDQVDDELEPNEDDEDGADECEHGVSLSEDCEDCEELEDEDDDELDDDEELEE